MPTPLDVRTDRRDGAVVLSVTGELDLSNVESFTDAIVTALGGHGRATGRTTVDLTAVEYLDSAAINALFDHAAQIRRIVANPILISVLTISGLTSVVEVSAAEGD